MNELGTIAGVIALTTFVVSQLKYWVSNTPYIRSVPLIFVSILVAVALTFLASWAGYLPGTTGQLVTQAVLAALGSGGLYGVWTGSATQTLKQTTEDKHVEDWLDPYQLFSILIAMFMIIGCTTQTGTSATRCYEAKVTYANMLETIQLLRDTGKVSQKTVNSLEPAHIIAKTALDEWERSSRSGNQPAAESAEQRFIRARDFIQSWIDNIQPQTYLPGGLLHGQGTTGTQPGEIPDGHRGGRGSTWAGYHAGGVDDYQLAY
jgi:hypothetical protein